MFMLSSKTVVLKLLYAEGRRRFWPNTVSIQAIILPLPADSTLFDPWKEKLDELLHEVNKITMIHNNVIVNRKWAL